MGGIGFKKSFLNAAMRGSTLVSKFLLLLVIARVYSVGEVGVYGLIFSLVSLFVYLLGLQYYNVSGRNLAGAAGVQRKGIWLVRHFNVVLSVLVFAPLILLVPLFYYELRGYAFVIFFLLLTEFCAGEFYRILIYFEKQIHASVLLFLRNGLWIWIFVIWIFVEDYFWGSFPDIRYLYYLWMTGGVLALLLGIWFLGKYRIYLLKVRFLSFRSLFYEAKSSFNFFISALSQRLIFTLDKYFIVLSAGVELTGVYTFYVGIAASVNSFMDAGVYSIYYPRLIKIVKQSELFVKEFKRFKKIVIGVSISIFLIYGLMIFPVLKFTGDSLYKEYLPLFILVMMAVTVLNLSRIYHYMLYIKREEKYILRASVINVIVFAVLALPMAFAFNVYGVGFSLLFSFTLLFYLKKIYSKRNG
ncbi:hypothetical protein QA597_09165 [Marinilabiliaceae bacterium ANBcel2]|nr:hypothetical protein [Marinilabiliaceae bacterium ANBcel2]